MKNATSAATLLNRGPLVVGVGLVSWLIFCLAATQAEVTNQVSLQSASLGWSGFTEGFDPYWSGDTKLINWRRGGGGGGSSFGITYSSYPPIFDLSPVKPIELLSSSRSTRTRSVSGIFVPGENVTAWQSGSSSSDTPGSWNAIEADYAQVIDLDDLVLGRGNSLSALDSAVNDYSYSLTSRQLASSSIDPIVNETSLVTGLASSNFTAAYQVNELVTFELSGYFGGVAEMEASFTLTDRSSGEVYFEQSVAEFGFMGKQIQFSYRGEFSPGIYDLNFSSKTQSAIKSSGVVEQGGLGEFALDFLAQPVAPWRPDAGDFDRNGVVDSADLLAWEASHGRLQNGDFNDDGDIDYSDYRTWELLDIAKDVTGDGRIRLDDFYALFDSTNQGDADLDSDSDGSDFLIWQRTRSTPNLSATSLQQVPEPQTAMLLVIGIFSLLLRTKT